MGEEDRLAKLAALPVSVRRDLVRVLLADPEVRADLIRQFYGREDAPNLAEVLIDLEADDVLRVDVLGLLEELENLSRAGGRRPCLCTRIELRGQAGAFPGPIGCFGDRGTRGNSGDGPVTVR